MSKSMFFVLCIISVAKLTDAAEYLITPQPKPDEFACQEGCYIEQLKRVLEYEESFSPVDGKQCIQYNCKSNGYTNVYTCGVIGVPDDCKVSYDRTIPYPSCCDPIINCPAKPAKEE